MTLFALWLIQILGIPMETVSKCCFSYWRMESKWRDCLFHDCPNISHLPHKIGKEGWQDSATPYRVPNENYKIIHLLEI